MFIYNIQHRLVILLNLGEYGLGHSNPSLRDFERLLLRRFLFGRHMMFVKPSARCRQDSGALPRPPPRHPRSLPRPLP